jgi:hypothetical protein
MQPPLNDAQEIGQLFHGGAILLGYVVLLVIPAIWYVIYRFVLSFEHFETYRSYPWAHRLVVIAAILFGWDLLVIEPQFAELLDPRIVLTRDGPWNVDWLTFLAERGNPMLHIGRAAASWDQLTFARSGWLQPVMVVPVALLLAIACVLAVAIRRGQPLLRVAGGAATVLILLIPLAVYLLMLTFYAVHVLNFWAILVVIIAAQIIRGRSSYKK